LQIQSRQNKIIADQEAGQQEPPEELHMDLEVDETPTMPLDNPAGELSDL